MKESEAGAVGRPGSPLGTIDRILRWLSSLQLGIALMLILIGAAILGTLIPQHTTEAFDRFYARLTPAERALYGHLGLFDVYHSWWFTAAILLFTINLVLCSMDRLPMILRDIREPKASATPLFARSQPLYTVLFTTRGSPEVLELLRPLFARLGWRPRVMAEAPRTTVFGERGAWSRWNFFLVHSSILLILGAAFVSARWGYEGTMILSPGTQTRSLTLPGSRWRGIPERPWPLPFTVRCEALRVDLKNPRGPLVPSNVINWYTNIAIEEGGSERRATVAINRPFDYRGYRFVHAGAGRSGDAHRITLVIRSENGPERLVSIEKNRTVTLPDLGEMRFVRFTGNFRARRSPSLEAEGYEDPAAEVEIVRPSGERRTLWVFSERGADPGIPRDLKDRVGIPVHQGTTDQRAALPGAEIPGYRFALRDFEKVSFEHVLHVRYDPGVTALYVGGALLGLSLLIAFSSSHERVWAVLEPEGSRLTIHLAAHAHRNEDRMQEKFHALARDLERVLAEVPPDQ
jgi:cytochrome c biogenesis protein